MNLTSKQKEYIRKNAKYFPVETLAKDLGLERKNIEKYLKKIWRRDKYEKYINKNKPNVENQYSKGLSSVSEFNLGVFFQKNLFIFIGLFLLVFVVYFNSLGNGFVSDDIPVFVNNPNLGNIKSIFQNGMIGSPEQVVYFLGHNFGGTNPAFFRIFNILFHIGSVWLIFIILSVLTKKRIAFLAAIIFAVHPIATESVTWISGIPYSMSGFFILLSLAFYIFKKNVIWTLLFFFLALLSLEKVMIFPFILLLYEFSIGGIQKIKENWKKMLLFFGLGFFWVIIFLSKVGYRKSVLETTGYQQGQEGMYNPLAQIPIAIGNYLKLIFWPEKLTLYHTEMSFNTGQYIFYLAIFLIFLAAVFWGWKKNKRVFFWLSFFFITLLPTLTPMKIAWIVAERYVYLGSIGIFVVAAMFFNWIFEKVKERNEQYKYAMIAVFVIIILSFSVRTIIRNMDWKNEDTLWIATAKVSSSGQNIHNNLGDVYGRQGNPEKAVEEFKKAIEINPRYADAYHNLGNTYRDMGRIDLAEENYQKALEFNSNLWQSYQNLAALFFNQGNYQKALEYIQKALAINPQNKNLQENLQVIESKIQK